MAELNDVELLSRLTHALAAPPAQPDEATLARLHSTLAELEVELAPIDIATARPRRIGVRGSVPRRQGRTIRRSSVLVASAVAFVLTAGVAAAAVATNTLPGPTRAFAYDLGLPVTSPGLFQAEQSAKQLKEAIAEKSAAEITRSSQALITELKTLDFSDFSEIRSTAERLLVNAGVSLTTISGVINSVASSTTLVPTVTVPSVSIPTVTSPTETIPSDSIPLVTVPGVLIPGISVPGLSVPGITVPGVSVPSVTTPSVTTPSVSVPSVSVPSVSIPSVSVPNITIPKITVPVVTIPKLP